MTDRILDITDQPAWLSVKLDQLIVEIDKKQVASVPLADLAVLILAHPRISLTQSVIARLAERGGVLITSDRHAMPIAMTIPLQTHHTQSTRFQLQADASEPTKKRCWQQIIRAKINAQAACLETYVASDHGLRALAKKVRSGDPDNIEAQAARRYWGRLFDNPVYRRGNPDAGENTLLNYGYAILRAIVARALCATGLHPGLGLHHAGRTDPFPLASDVMEPFRPMIDTAVAQWTREHTPGDQLTQEARTMLLSTMLERRNMQGEQRTCFDIVMRTAQSLTRAYAGESRTLDLPTS